MAGLESVTLTKSSDKDAEADLYRLVTRQFCDGQFFAGHLTCGQDDLFTDWLNPEMQFLESHLEQLSNVNLPLHN